MDKVENHLPCSSKKAKIKIKSPEENKNLDLHMAQHNMLLQFTPEDPPRETHIQ